ncbi:major facilitator superfamily domain-containing protein [Aspergillus heterothallicus]
MEPKTEEPLHVERVRPNDDEDDDDGDAASDQSYEWNLDVCLNLAGPYLTNFSATWQMIALPMSLAFINEAFPTETHRTAWVASVTGLCQCVICFFVGELSDILGRRWFIISACVSMSVGGFIAGRATSVDMIIGGQVIAGIGGGIAFLANPAAAEMVPKHSRSIALSALEVLNGVVSIGCALSTGAFTQYNVGGPRDGWRAAVYIGVGISCVGALVNLFFYQPGHRPNPEGLTNKGRLLKIDWIGILIGTAGLVLLLLGLDFGGNPDPWDSPKVLCTLLIGIALMGVFVVWEVFFTTFGMFPRPIFRHRNIPIYLAIQFAEGMALNTGISFMPQEMVTLFTTHALLAQVRNLPFGSFSLVGAAIFAVIMYRTRETKWVLISGVCFGMLTGGLMSALKHTSNYASWFFPSMFLGLSSVAVSIGIMIAATLCTPNEFIATTISLTTSIRSLGAAVGVVVFSQILQYRLKTGLPHQVAQRCVPLGLPPTSIPQLLEASVTGNETLLFQVPGDDTGNCRGIRRRRQGGVHRWVQVWLVCGARVHGSFPCPFGLPSAHQATHNR